MAGYVKVRTKRVLCTLSLIYLRYRAKCILVFDKQGLPSFDYAMRFKWNLIPLQSLFLA